MRSGGTLDPLLLVESDGSYRLLDVLAICEESATDTGLRVASAELDHFLDIASSAYPPLRRPASAVPPSTPAAAAM